MAIVQLHRTNERRHLAIPVRVERLEEDADTMEARHTELVDKLDRISARLLGIILAMAGGALTLGANYVIFHH